MLLPDYDYSVDESESDLQVPLKVWERTFQEKEDLKKEKEEKEERISQLTKEKEERISELTKEKEKRISQLLEIIKNISKREADIEKKKN